MVFLYFKCLLFCSSLLQQQNYRLTHFKALFDWRCQSESVNILKEGRQEGKNSYKFFEVTKLPQFNIRACYCNSALGDGAVKIQVARFSVAKKK